MSAFSLEGGEKIVEEEEGEDGATSSSNNALVPPSHDSLASTPNKGSVASGLVVDSITMMEKRRKFEDTREEFLSHAKRKNIGLREVKIEFAKSATIKRGDCRRKLVSLGFKPDELSDEKFHVLFSAMDATNSGSIYTDELVRLFEREIEEDQMACEVPEVEDDDVPEKLHQHGVLEIDVRAAKDLGGDARLRRGGTHRRQQRKVHFSAPEYTAQELSRRRQAATTIGDSQVAEPEYLTQTGARPLFNSPVELYSTVYSHTSDVGAAALQPQPSTLESGLHKSERMKVLEQKRRERLATLQAHKLAAIGDRQKTAALPRLIGGRKSGSGFVSCVDCGSRVLLGGRSESSAAPASAIPAFACAGAKCTNSFCKPCFQLLPERKQFCDECFQHELVAGDVDRERLLCASSTGSDSGWSSPSEDAKLTAAELAVLVSRTLDEIIGAAFDAYEFSASTSRWLRTQNSTKPNALRVFHDATLHKAGSTGYDAETETVLFTRVLSLRLSDAADDGGSCSPSAVAKVFERFDADRSGRIDQDEFTVFASALGLHLGPDDTQLLMCRIESASSVAMDGSVGFANFMAYVEMLLQSKEQWVYSQSDGSTSAGASLRDVILQLDALTLEDPSKREALCDILQQLQWNTRKEDAVATCKQIRDAVGLHLSVSLLQRLGNAVAFHELHAARASRSQRTTLATEHPEDDAVLELKSSGDVLKCLLFSIRSTAIPHLTAFHVGTVCERVRSLIEQLSGSHSCESVWRSVFGLETSERIDQRDFLDTLVGAGYVALPVSSAGGASTSPVLRCLLAKLEMALALDALRLKSGEASANDAASGFVTFSLFTVLVRFATIQQLEARFDQALVNFLRLCQGRQHYLVSVSAVEKTLVVRVIEPIFKFQMDFILGEHEYARENLLRSFPRALHTGSDQSLGEQRMFSASSTAVITNACYPSLNDEMLALISRLRIATSANVSTPTDHRGMIPFLTLVEGDSFVATLRASLARADLPFFWSVSSALLELSIDGDYLEQLQRPSFHHVVAEALARQSPASRALASLMQHTDSSLQVRYEVVGKDASFLSPWDDFQAVLAGHQDTYAVVEVCPQGDVFATDVDRAGTTGTARWNCKRQIVLREPELCDQRIDRPVVYTDTVKVSAVPGGTSTTKPVTFVVDAASHSTGHFVVLSVRRAQPAGRGDTPRLYCTAYDPFTACEYAVEGHPADWASDFFAPSSSRNIESEWLTILKGMRLGATLTPKILVRVFNKQAKTERLIGECEVSIGSAVAQEGHSIDDWFALQHPLNSAKTTGFINVAVRFEAKKASDVALALTNGGMEGRTQSRSRFVEVKSGTEAVSTSADVSPLENHAPVQGNVTLQAQKRARELEEALQTSESAKREANEQVRVLRSQVQQLAVSSSAAVTDEATQWRWKLDRALDEQRQQHEEHEQRYGAACER